LDKLSQTPLPQRFAWVRSADEGASALNLLSAVTPSNSETTRVPADIHRQEIEAVAIAAARASLNTKSDSFTVIRFHDHQIVPGSALKFSGFQLYHRPSLVSGIGRRAALATIVYVPAHDGRPSDFPLTFLHVNREDLGGTIKRELNDWSRATLGATAEEHLAARRAKTASTPSLSLDVGATGASVSNAGSVVGEVAVSALDAAAAGVDAGDILDGVGGLLEGLGEVIGGIFEGLS
jgi:hypothetical protein